MLSFKNDIQSQQSQQSQQLQQLQQSQQSQQSHQLQQSQQSQQSQQTIKEYDTTNLKTREYLLWVEKYRPKSLGDMIELQDQIKQINEWFSRYLKNDNTIKRALIFTGPPGTSKTSLAHIILKENGFNIIEFNSSDVRNKTKISENIQKIINSMNNKSSIPNGIVMDEIDGLSSGDKGGLSHLISIINPLKGINKKKNKIYNIPPIICICNDIANKKINELKKECLEIRFTKPSINTLIQLINIISDKESININNYAKYAIANLAQNDYRRLIYILQCLKNISFQTNVIDTSHVCELEQIISNKFISLDAYNATNKILGKPMKIQDIRMIYELEKSILPMMIHENYNIIINSLNTTVENKLKLSKDIIDSICTSDIIDKLMYTNQKWQFQTIHCITSCYFPNKYVNTYPYVTKPLCKWNTALGKFSSQKSNIKNILKITKTISNGRSYNIYDIHFFSNILIHKLLFDENNINKQIIGINFLKKYNFNIYDLEKIIKINKLNTFYKDKYKSKHKTALIKMYGQPLENKTIPLLFNLTGKKSLNEIKKINLQNNAIDSQDNQIDSQDNPIDHQDNSTDHQDQTYKVNKNESDCDENNENDYDSDSESNASD